MFWWALGRASPLGFWKALGIAWGYSRQKGHVNRMTRQQEREFDREHGLSA